MNKEIKIKNFKYLECKNNKVSNKQIKASMEALCLNTYYCTYNMKLLSDDTYITVIFFSRFSFPHLPLELQ